jgi:hypothetical protein
MQSLRELFRFEIFTNLSRKTRLIAKSQISNETYSKFGEGFSKSKHVVAVRFNEAVRKPNKLERIRISLIFSRDLIA